MPSNHQKEDYNVEEEVALSSNPEGTGMTLVEKDKPGRRKFQESGVIGDLNEMVVLMQNEVLDKREVTLEQLKFMTRNDGQAKGILNAIKYPVRMARAQIKEDEDGEAEADFIRTNFLSSPSENGFITPLRTTIARMSLAVRDGYKIFEKVFQYKDGKIWLKNLAYRSNETTTFTYDNHGNIKGAKQKTNWLGREIDAKWGTEKIAYFVYNAEENPYFGDSDFYPVFYHYDKKHKLYAIAHIAYQLNAVPLRLGKHPRNLAPDSVDIFRESLRQLGTSIAMTCSEECTVEVFESKRSLSEFLALVEHHDAMMARCFLTQFMNKEGNLSQDDSNLFLMSIMSLLADIAEVMNTQVIPQLIDWNFGTKKYPRVEFTPFSDSIRSAIMTTFNNLLAARFPQVSQEFVLSLEEQIAKELGLDLNYEEIATRIEEEREALAEAEATAKTEDVKGEGNISSGKGVKPAAGGGEED